MLLKRIPRIVSSQYIGKVIPIDKFKVEMLFG
jgi:hypothetical protein